MKQPLQNKKRLVIYISTLSLVVLTGVFVYKISSGSSASELLTNTISPINSLTASASSTLAMQLANDVTSMTNPFSYQNLQGNEKNVCNGISDINIDTVIGLIRGFYRIGDDGCSEAVIDANWSYRLYYLPGNPIRTFVKVHIYGTIQRKYLDGLCNIQTDPVIKFDVWVVYENTGGKLVKIPDLPSGSKLTCPIVIPGGHTTIPIGKIDKEKCPNCAKSTPPTTSTTE